MRLAKAFALLLILGCGPDSVELPDLPPAIDVAARVATIHDRGCVRLLDDRLACWEDFVLACTPDLERHAAVVIARDARGVVFGRSSCAWFDAGVKCWGDFNDYGIHGQGDTLLRGTDIAPVPALRDIPFIDLGTTAAVRSVVAGAAACALFEDGRIKCWGGWDFGLPGVSQQPLGDQPGEMGDALPYVDLGRDATVENLDADASTICAVLGDGRLKCWGLNNAEGHLGLGDTRDRGLQPGEMGDALPAVDLGTDARVIDVGVGVGHTCAVLEGGGVKCWGRNHDIYTPFPIGDDEIIDAGRLGYGDRPHRGASPEDMGDNLPFVDLGTGARAVAVDLGRAHSCALLDDGRVKCWGVSLDQDGNWSAGDSPGEMGDALPAYDFGGRPAVGLSAEHDSTCVVLDDGDTLCWGPSMEIECPIILPQ